MSRSPTAQPEPQRVTAAEDASAPPPSGTPVAIPNHLSELKTLHVTALPDEAAAHADAIFLGPGEDTWPLFLDDFRRGEPRRRYVSTQRTLAGLPRGANVTLSRFVDARTAGNVEAGGRWYFGTPVKAVDAVRNTVTLADDGLMEIADKIVSELTIEWFFNIQLVGERVIEINPRISTVVYQEDLNLPWLGVKRALGELSDRAAVIWTGEDWVLAGEPPAEFDEVGSLSVRNGSR